MLRGIAIAVLVIGIAGTAYWGYQEHREKTAVLINAENNYQRAFHDLTYQIDLLNDKIGTTLAMNSRSSLSPQLAEVWKITSQAHNDVGQLPLTLLPFNKTEEFLANIGNFSYKAAIRDLDKEPLTEKEYSTLKTLYEQSGEIQQDLRQVQHMVLENNLRWMDVELALATEKGQTDNTIIDGFKTVEKTVEGYTETDFGPAQINLQKKDENFKKLPGEQISKEKAIQITRKYTPVRNGGNVKVTENGKGSDYGFFSVSIQNPKSKLEANMDITKKGGYPIWFLLDRDVKNQKLSLNDASNKAIAFLKDHNFENLDLFESAQYDNIGVFTFVGTQDDVRIYPDAINMKVALDNGDVIGFSAEDYLKSHKTREIPQVGIDMAEAKKKVNPNLKVMDEKQAIILNDINEEVLCYEFTGVLGNDTFRIYINAEDGTEEKVEKLQNAEPVYEDVV
ncbi:MULTISPECIES: germination protein YpeB [unclassified Bacillus (in: firmicutes)]|uniref:germination protein YpeB n=1 Tax=unclassified Bacillus (in: firmicutes) TaxID=185979 RepID=UPI001BE5D22D|nr:MULTISPECIES: germination protein YpeB [unclassified Bacillus (in: firmicutes)]MBT2638858.1 germination protein YpeB [Bacillus sp. ISL-39]MBT2661000.1 germination protein YpeB [Bacillus sp. ISL-45]